MSPEEFGAYLEDLFSNYIFACNLGDLTVSEKSLLRSALGKIQARAKSRYDFIKEEILSDLKESGGGTITTSISEISINETKSKLPEADSFKTLLIEKDIPLESGMNTIIKLEPSAHKIDFLIKTGKLDAGEVDKLRDTKTSMKIKLLGEYKDILGDN